MSPSSENSQAKHKKEFDWKPGKELQKKDYVPVKEVHDEGFNKLADGLPADPYLRKEERKAQLAVPVFKVKDKNIVLEETHSGLHRDISSQDASKLIDQGQRKIPTLFGDVSVSTKIPKDE